MFGQLEFHNLAILSEKDLRASRSCSVSLLKETRIAVKLNNTATYCPKIMGLPERVDMATVAMATDLGHMSMQMPFIR